jgi:hypothetical protein
MLRLARPVAAGSALQSCGLAEERSTPGDLMGRRGRVAREAKDGRKRADGVWSLGHCWTQPESGNTQRRGTRPMIAEATHAAGR